MASSTVYRPWLMGLLGLLVLAVLNGTVRATVLEPRLGEDAARREATAVLLGVLTGHVRRLQPRHSIPDAKQAWVIGVTWVVMTLGFGFGFGRLVAPADVGGAAGGLRRGGRSPVGARAAVDRCGTGGGAAADPDRLSGRWGHDRRGPA